MRTSDATSVPRLTLDDASSASVARAFVSIVIPCRNERAFIVECLDSILATTWPHDRLEVIVVDGMSDDGTRERLQAYIDDHPVVRTFDNAQRITPVALNIGVRAARGDVVVRMDAHNFYPPDYVPRLVEALFASGADNVGGVWITKPGAATPAAAAIALALAHPFGVGNAHYRIGSTAPRWVDTVPFGCYRRDVFDRIGLFDEELVRNQDDEFNLRLIRSGGRILLVPTVWSEYHARPSYAKLWRMYFQYGLFKPLVIKKVRAVLTVRQLVPALFVLSLATLLVGSAVLPLARWGLLGLASTYALASVIAAVRAGRNVAAPVAARLLLVFPLIHIAYGWGFIRGAVRAFLRGPGRLGGSHDPLPLTR